MAVAFHMQAADRSHFVLGQHSTRHLLAPKDALRMRAAAVPLPACLTAFRHLIIVVLARRCRKDVLRPLATAREYLSISILPI